MVTETREVESLSRIENLVSHLSDFQGTTIETVDGGVSTEVNRKLISCPQAFLSHGDFDTAHIFSVGGVYSGIIDFGDIRCCSPYHDLAHFYTYSQKRFDDLLKGYLEVTNLGDRVQEEI